VVSHVRLSETVCTDEKKVGVYLAAVCFKCTNRTLIADLLAVYIIACVKDE
jgi:hypothetical protein